MVSISGKNLIRTIKTFSLGKQNGRLMKKNSVDILIGTIQSTNKFSYFTCTVHMLDLRSHCQSTWILQNLCWSQFCTEVSRDRTYGSIMFFLQCIGMLMSRFMKNRIKCVPWQLGRNLYWIVFWCVTFGSKSGNISLIYL